ncbi:uncharacterized protein LOC113334026 [Papaver somniferum]|uniref:uncharacterized protein LOC113334026 n=1 Tax=Papaver somniferum TaxID=3469 RepID=UPI000E700528|nr:uncharacterized protein LOC113334026 [Papaver somniferum]
MKGVMWGTDYERHILHCFQIQYSKVKRVRIIELLLCLPSDDEILMCCDGASRGNPGLAGYGFIFRNNSGDFVFAEYGGLGIVTNYIDEFIASIRALEWEVENQWFKVILQSDSKDCITSLTSHQIPWFLIARWQRIVAGMLLISYRHVYRETNFSADHFAKKGVHLQKGQTLNYKDRPACLTRMETPDQSYYKFD